MRPVTSVGAIARPCCNHTPRRLDVPRLPHQPARNAPVQKKLGEVIDGFRIGRDHDDGLPANSPSVSRDDISDQTAYTGNQRRRQLKFDAFQGAASSSGAMAPHTARSGEI